MTRSALIDGTKAVASQVIVLHHLSLYAPMTDWLAQVWPAWVDFLSQHGRLAVQPFLVIGGFLTAQSLQRLREVSPVPQIGQRYLRLLPQLVLALSLVLLATAMVGSELAHEDWVSPWPSWRVLLAHILFLQDVMGVPALSAGVWYVAIDLQLYALLAVLAWGSRRTRRSLDESLAPWVVAVATAASIVVFSRQASLDAWAVYFLSAYGLGALSAWASMGKARARLAWWLTLAVLVTDWLVDPRPRPALALATALVLLVGTRVDWTLAQGVGRRVIEFLSDMSYSVFVCHFAVIVAISGVWERFDFEGLAWACLFAVLAWGLSLAVGTGVQRVCERWLHWRRASA